MKKKEGDKTKTQIPLTYQFAQTMINSRTISLVDISESQKITKEIFYKKISKF